MKNLPLKKWAQSPRKELVDNISQFKKGSVLDLGGSDGVNDLYLAQQGYDVTVIDKDSDAISMFLSDARELNLNVTGIVRDIGDYLVDSFYDNIISFFLFHFLDSVHAESLLESIMKNTTTGGVNLLVGFTDVGEFNVDSKINTRFYPHAEYLANVYKTNGFEVISYQKSTGPTKSGKNQEKYSLLARKR